MPTKRICYRWDDVPGKGDFYLRTGDASQIVSAALKPNLNPDAPEIILVGEGRNIESKAQKLCDQSSPISVYIKRGTHKWEYSGDFVVTHCTKSEEEIRHHAKRSNRDDIVRIIYLKECEDENEIC